MGGWKKEWGYEDNVNLVRGRGMSWRRLGKGADRKHQDASMDSEIYGVCL